MKRFLVGMGAVVFLAASIPTAVEAQLITFDEASVCPAGTGLTDLTGSSFAGFNWSNFFVVNAALQFPGSGYDHAVSAPCVAFNGGGAPSMILSNPVPFLFASSWFNAAWHTGLTINVEGWLGGVQLFAATFIEDASTPMTFRTFGWVVDEVRFVGTGGTNNDLNGDLLAFGGQNVESGQLIVFDNLTVTVIPEPASMVLLLSGLAGVGVARRRRKQLGRRLSCDRQTVRTIFAPRGHGASGGGVFLGSREWRPRSPATAVAGVRRPLHGDRAEVLTTSQPD